MLLLRTNHILFVLELNYLLLQPIITMDDYAKYELACEEIRFANKELLKEFEMTMLEEWLGENSIKKHLSNIDLYINEFLLYEEPIEAKNGSDEVGMYLWYWFIKKSSRASSAGIKQSASTIKKFYSFLNKKGMIDDHDMEILKERIQEELPEWIATVRRYDDTSITDMEKVRFG